MNDYVLNDESIFKSAYAEQIVFGSNLVSFFVVHTFFYIQITIHHDEIAVQNIQCMKPS
jgi:hypothetical protein